LLLLYNRHIIIIIIIILLWKHSCKISKVTCNNCKDHRYVVWRIAIACWSRSTK